MKNSNSVPFFDQLKEEFIAPEVEKIIQQHFSAPPPNTLEPKKIWQQKIRDSLTDILSGQAVIDKTAAGFEAIKEDLSSRFTPAEMDKISKEWNQGVEIWLEKMHKDMLKVQQTAERNESFSQIPIENVQVETLQSVMGISEETLKKFYESGNRYFETKDYEKASDVYFVVASLDQHRYNAWLALGLSEVRCERTEPALVSFGMASLVNPESPYPYVYSAECCLKDNRREEAGAYLNLARDAVEKSSLENKQALLDVIAKLQKEV